MESSLACGAGCLAGVAAFYRLARPHFSVRVNCHFCNQNTRVSYNQSNSFHCPHCGQYNGWDSNGDYNIQLGMGDQGIRFVREQSKVDKQGNGLCRNCNLNQELKVSQLARFNKDGQELEEYRQHLEKVYKLCAVCEDFLATKLLEQDRKMANKLLEVRLERSRLNSSSKGFKKNTSSQWLPFMQSFLALTVFSLLQDYSQFSVPVHIKDTMENMLTVPMQMISSHLDIMFPLLSVSEVVIPLIEMINMSLILVAIIFMLVMVSFCNKSFLSILLYTILLIIYISSTPHIVQLSLAGVGVIIAVVNTPPTPNNTLITSQGSSKVGVAYQQYRQRNIEVEDTLTQDLLDSSSDSITPTDVPPSPAQPASTAPITSTPPPTTSTPPPTTLMRTGDEFSFTHEFATQHEGDDCDLSSLSLGEIPTKKNMTSPFSLSQYSPCSPTNSLFSPSRPLLHPSRLTNTSWVAGGYWTPPGQTNLQSPSRSSSHSSGFVSGTPSLANYPSPPGSLHNYFPPIPTSPQFHHHDIDRFSVLSEPVHQLPHLPPPRHYAASTHTLPHVQHRRRSQDDCLSNASIDRHSQVSQTSQTSLPPTQTKSGWSLTITLTPTGVILAVSIAVNVTLAVMWFRQDVGDY